MCLCFVWRGGGPPSWVLFYLQEPTLYKRSSVYLYPVWHCLQPCCTMMCFKVSKVTEADVQLFLFFFQKLLHDILRNVHSHFFSPVHIKFRIKRKAVPSCLQPRPPLPRLYSTSGFEPGTNESSIKRREDSLCCQMSDLSACWGLLPTADREVGER